MTRIALVRHGQTDYNKNKIIQGRVDIPLNELGKTQALKTAQHFEDEQIDLIIASPLIRAVETAQIIADEINYDKKIKTNAAFIERNFGEVDGKSIPLYIKQIHAEDGIKGLESSDAIKKRMIEGIYQVIEENPNQYIMIVCHSHAIKAVLAALEPEKYDFKTHLNNCGITLLDYEEKKLKIIKASYNDYI